MEVTTTASVLDYDNDDDYRCSLFSCYNIVLHENDLDTAITQLIERQHLMFSKVKTNQYMEKLFNAVSKKNPLYISNDECAFVMLHSYSYFKHFHELLMAVLNNDIEKCQKTCDMLELEIFT